MMSERENNCLPRHHHKYRTEKKKPALFMILLPPFFGKSLTKAKKLWIFPTFIFSFSLSLSLLCSALH